LMNQEGVVDDYPESARSNENRNKRSAGPSWDFFSFMDLVVVGWSMRGVLSQDQYSYLYTW
jgi:hypothetical protein